MAPSRRPVDVIGKTPLSLAGNGHVLDVKAGIVAPRLALPALSAREPRLDRDTNPEHVEIDAAAKCDHHTDRLVPHGAIREFLPVP